MASKSNVKQTDTSLLVTAAASHRFCRRATASGGSHPGQPSLYGGGMGILDGKVAIVTGASRGIGAEIARRFAAEGAAVAVAARTTDTGTSPFPGTIAETTEQIRAAGGTAVPIRADLSKPEDRERLVTEAE